MNRFKEKVVRHSSRGELDFQGHKVHCNHPHFRSKAATHALHLNRRKICRAMSISENAVRRFNVRPMSKAEYGKGSSSILMRLP
jgi:hypothetical protein